MAQDLTDLDFDALRLRLIELAQSAFPEWTDFSVPSFGTTLLEMLAFVGDVLSGKLDNHILESRLSTATQRRSVIALTRMLGYRLRGAGAATAEVVFQLETPALADVRFPAGSVVRTPDVTESIRFVLLSEVVIPKGQTTVRGIVENAEPQSTLADATGAADFEVVLDQVPYLDGSAQVDSAAGAFREVETFLNSTATDRHFVVLVDSQDRATLRFGDGRTGAVPKGTLRIVYKSGGGAKGLVERDRLRIYDAPARDVEGRAVRLSVTNPERSSGGVERESLALAKLLAPATLRATDRSVGREDFETHAQKIAGVARALMLTSNEDRAIAENSGVLFIVPTGGGLPTDALKKAVLDFILTNYPPTLTFELRVQDPPYKAIDVAAQLVATDPRGIGDAIRARLADFFRISLDDGSPNPLINFGYYTDTEVAWSDVLNVVRDTPGVRKVTSLALNGAPSDVGLRGAEFPILGSVAIVDGAGQPL